MVALYLLPTQLRQEWATPPLGDAGQLAFACRTDGAADRTIERVILSAKLRRRYYLWRRPYLARSRLIVRSARALLVSHSSVVPITKSHPASTPRVQVSKPLAADRHPAVGVIIRTFAASMSVRSAPRWPGLADCCWVVCERSLHRAITGIRLTDRADGDRAGAASAMPNPPHSAVTSPRNMAPRAHLVGERNLCTAGVPGSVGILIHIRRLHGKIWWNRTASGTFT